MSLRYAAQLVLPGWDQKRLAEATALIVGLGGLGSPAALYLAAMGIGRLLLVDPDTIAESNLHRQPLYSPTELGQRKIDSLAQTLQRLRADLKIEKYPVWAQQDFLQKVGAAADIWIDGTDNLASRLAIDAAAYTLGKPWVYGAIYQWEGQAALLHGVRYKDFFGEVAAGPACSEAGVLGGIPGIIGSLQASLAAMYLSLPAAAPIGRLYRIDLRSGQAETFLLAAPAELPLELTLAQARQLADSQWIVVDEAPPPDFVESFVHQPWYGWDRWELPARPIVLVCQAGNRSRQIAFALRQKTGRKDIHSLSGGWQSLLAPT